MAKRRVANPLAFAVLGCLVERPMHPYEISTTLRTRGKDQSIKLNYGSLYSVVSALEKHGLIEAVETVREGNRPERTVYAATDDGRAEFEDWLAELLGEPAQEFSQLEAGLAYLPAFAPERVVDLLDQRAEKLAAAIDEREAMHKLPAMQALQALPRIFWVESEFRLELLQAELAYARRLADEIRSGEFEGVALWRRMHELIYQEGVSPADLFKDPVKYLGEEASWLSELPEGSV